MHSYARGWRPEDFANYVNSRRPVTRVVRRRRPWSEYCAANGVLIARDQRGRSPAGVRRPAGGCFLDHIGVWRRDTSPRDSAFDLPGNRAGLVPVANSP